MDVKSIMTKFSGRSMQLLAGSLLLAAPLAAQQRDSVKTRSELPMKVYINGRDVSPQVTETRGVLELTGGVLEPQVA